MSWQLRLFFSRPNHNHTCRLRLLESDVPFARLSPVADLLPLL